jgi:hypothetical protein
MYSKERYVISIPPYPSTPAQDYQPLLLPSPHQKKSFCWCVCVCVSSLRFSLSSSLFLTSRKYKAQPARPKRPPVDGTNVGQWYKTHRAPITCVCIHVSSPGTGSPLFFSSGTLCSLLCLSIDTLKNKFRRLFIRTISSQPASAVIRH